VRRAERAVARASEGARPPALSRARRPTAHPGRGLIHALALLAALGWAAQARAADPAPAPAKTIALKGDRLTVKVSAVPLDEVLQAIVAPSSGEIRGSVKQPHDVSIDFEEVPVQDGLGRLLGDQNFVLTFRENGTLRSLTLLGGPQEATSEARIVKPTQPGQPVATATEMMQRNVPVPAGSKLAQFLGQPTATLQQLLDISIRYEDASLRVEAMRASMGAIDTQADLKAMVVKSLRDTDDRTLENVIRGVAQDRAREIVSQIAAITQTPEIRARTTRLLQQMQPTPTAQ
jgi:hypothetical protein